MDIDPSLPFNMEFSATCYPENNKPCVLGALILEIM